MKFSALLIYISMFGIGFSIPFLAHGFYTKNRDELKGWGIVMAQAVFTLALGIGLANR